MENPQQVDQTDAAFSLNSGQLPIATDPLKTSRKTDRSCSSSIPSVPFRDGGQDKMNRIPDEFSKQGRDMIFKNTRENPFYMMHTVQQSVIFQELDFSYITSRIAVMSYPGEASESACRNHVEDVREYLDLRHPGHYAVYNVSGHAYLSAKFSAKVYEAGWPMRKAPPLKTLISLCRSMYLYLRQDPRNICVVHCLDGKSSSAVLVCAFLIFGKLFKQPEEALKMFGARRCPVSMSPSQLRYMQYMSFIVGSPPLLPHNNAVALHSISMRPVPLCNECSNGCRPFVEVYVGEECIFTSLEDYENIRYYNFNDKCIVIPISAGVVGDVTIIVYHAKSTFSRMALGKRTTAKIFQLQFHSGFLSSSAQTMTLNRSELDCVEGLITYPDDFTVTVLFNSACKKSPDISPLIRKVAQLKINPELLFNADEDLEAFTSHFMNKENISEGSQNSNFTCSVNHSEQGRCAENTHIFCIDSESDSVLSMDDLDSFHTVEGDLLNMRFVPSPHEGDVPLVDLIEDASPPDLLESVRNSPLIKEDTSSTSYDSLLKKISTGIPENTSNRTADSFFQFCGKVSTDSGTSEDDLSVHFASGISSTFSKTLSNTDSETSFVSGPSLSNINSTSNDDIRLLRDSCSPSSFSASTTGKRQVNPISRHVSAPNLKTLANSKSDPFADLGNIMSSFDSSFKSQSEVPHSSFTESTTRHFQKQQSNKSSVPEGISQKPSNKRSHFSGEFADRNNRGAKKYSGVKPKFHGNEFEDLLGSQGYGRFQRNIDNEPKTMAMLRHMEMVKDMDPEHLKVLDWVGCQRHNIRALLCSLHTVLWEGTRWQEIGMHRLISAGDVKRYYRKACLAVHPDKQMGTKNENLARLIFMELKDAWNKFEKQPNVV